MSGWQDLQWPPQYLETRRSPVTNAEALDLATTLQETQPAAARTIRELVDRCKSLTPIEPSAPKEVQMSTEATESLMASLNSVRIAVGNGAVQKDALLQQLDHLRQFVATQMQRPDWLL